MLNILLLRHGQTAGNALHKYLGSTDEGLNQEGIAALTAKAYPAVQRVYCSPMLRCRQTAKLLFPGQQLHLELLLRECNFGSFEYCTAEELANQPLYQQWVDSGGLAPFPQGEQVDAFKARCCLGFSNIIQQAQNEQLEQIAIVAHGGTLMSIMEHWALPRQDFYDWHTANGCGYQLQLGQKDRGQIALLHWQPIDGEQQWG